jgi:hypothetical protein
MDRQRHKTRGSERWHPGTHYEGDHRSGGFTVPGSPRHHRGRRRHERPCRPPRGGSHFDRTRTWLNFAVLTHRSPIAKSKLATLSGRPFPSMVQSERSRPDLYREASAQPSGGLHPTDEFDPECQVLIGEQAHNCAIKSRPSKVVGPTIGAQPAWWQSSTTQTATARRSRACCLGSSGRRLEIVVAGPCRPGYRRRHAEEARWGGVRAGAAPGRSPRTHPGDATADYDRHAIKGDAFSDGVGDFLAIG